MNQTTPAEIRLLFLREFAKRIILSEKPSLFEVYEAEAKKPLLEEFEVLQIKIPAKIKRAFEGEFIPSITPPIQPIHQLTPPALIEKISPIEKAKTPALPAPVKVEEKISSPLPSLSGMEKIKPLMQDPSVASIECVGANKNLTINKKGMMQQINLTLNEDEIKSVLREISQKTRIPITSGLFKVAYQNFIITAFISEFVGSRFLIKKRAPGFLPSLTTPIQPMPRGPIKF